ncbi:oxidoreductase [Paenibacillus baekrokdamisoli]|uniref:Oxidoreductase n=1 Tax=Paenibacillus baekrokdamisoli TaxID=1712516 RepID=A0A3G9J0E0_9BACL|nr:FAD-dependent oxidoreductase [Paenibacillus baekrokdamisoli]MBB3071676.1 glycine/D-amino acid oxidase-like deaminating enzyme [Paenibacillus baekrokdamisoli]BBH21815.1 oxidoreductase [Paenibacillus baekrokdamisoli]
MKDLHNGTLYWPQTMEHYRTYPQLAADIDVQVAIVGGGMSGAACGYALAKNGIQACILERGEVAGGSTSANTGLLQFCNDVMLSALIDQIGETDAVSFYKACKQAVEQIGQIASELDVDVGFISRSSLYYASTESELPNLKREFAALKNHGFDVEFWTPEDISAHYPFSKPGAIITHGDAEINPFRFVHALADAASKLGLAVHEHTDIVAHITQEDGRQHLQTASGATVLADHVIYAIGYEPEELRGQLIKAAISRTYAIATAPQPNIEKWFEHHFIWETARPYFYMRTTSDGRVIAGGLDEETPEPLTDVQARYRRTDKLYDRVKEHFPTFDAPLTHDWTATFGESRDNLPFIGVDPSWPNVYYCLGYGGNGTVYSMIASHLLRNLISGKDHPIAPIVRLDRPSLQNV